MTPGPIDVMSQARTINERNHIAALDGLRGVAALIVVAGHTFISMGNPEAVPAHYLPVDLFFSLSGYVLAAAYEKRLSTGLAPAEFMKRRLIRLYPMLVLGIAVCATAVAFKLIVFHETNEFPVLLSWVFFGLLYLPSFGATVPYPLLAPAWSLTCEIVANIVYAYFYPYLSDRVVVAIVILFAVGMVLATIAVGSISEIGHWWSMWVGFVRVFFSFFVGVLIYRKRSKVPRCFARIPTELLLVLFGLYLFIPGATSVTAGVRDLFFVGIVSPFLVAAGAISQSHFRATDSVMTFLGGASYPVYTLHWPFSLRMHAIVPKIQGFEILTVIIFTAGTAVIGFLADRYLDRPIRSYLTEKMTTKQDNTASPATAV